MITNLKFNKVGFLALFIFTASNYTFAGMFPSLSDAAAKQIGNQLKKLDKAAQYFQYLMSSSGVAGVLTGGLTGVLAGVTCNPAVICLSLASNLGLNVAVTKTLKELALSDEDPMHEAVFIALQSELPDDCLKHVYVGNTQMIGNIAGLAVGAFIGVSIYSLILALSSKKDSKKQQE